MNTHHKSLLWKLLIPVPMVLLVAMLAAGYFVPVFIADNARDDAVIEAEKTVILFKTLRAYYTANVVHKVLGSGLLKSGIEHRSDERMIPLPATMIHDISDLLSQQGMNVYLYSLFPFPNRADRQLDTFQLQAWTHLNDNPASTYSEQIKIDGQEYVRVAIADKMIADVCVDCHNSHIASPKTDWRLGDVRGVLEVRKQIDKQLASGQQLAYRILVAILVTGILIILSLMLLVRRHVLQPLNSLTASTQAMALGDMNVRVSKEYNAEVNTLAEAFNQMAENLSEKDRRELSHLKKLQQAADIKEEVNSLCHYVEKVARGDLSARLTIPENDQLAGLARNLNCMTEGLVKITSEILEVSDIINERVEQVEIALSSQHESATRQANTALRSTSTLNQLVERSKWTVKRGEELGKTAQLTQEQAQNGLNSVQSAISSAKDMRQHIDSVGSTISGLSTRILEIDKITNTVRRLAMQSKFLAFNAAIESAKAGEAGKGFAIVSQEVRQLADQSESATREVKQLLEDIYGAMDLAIKATKHSDKQVEENVALIQESGNVIQQLTEVIYAAAQSSEENVLAVHEETRSIDGVRSDIAGFSDDTKQMVNAANDALLASKELRELTLSLREKVRIYRI